ncbi:hypothetical protein SDC9_61789 [bioreactor metagenome]|uniref:DUF8173 domain-containing protein n=1 Tax=bioreactor metagenome TaxID=1076179 RepID=A0A644XHZ9_9ZZZZ
MKKISLISLFLVVFGILFTPSVLAQTKTKAIVTLPTFKASEIELVDKPIIGDLMIAGKQIKITSDVSGDVYVAGGKVEVEGKVGGNLIVAGGEVKILGKVSKNLIMAGGKVEVGELTEIGGYTLAGGQEISLLGKFMGPVKLGSESLVVGQKAIINGNLEADVTNSEISSDSKIVGEKNIKIHEVKKPEIEKNQFKKIGYAGKFISFLSKLLVLLVFIKFFGKKINSKNINDSFLANIGFGLMLLIMAPFVMLILAITIVGLPLSFIFLAIYLLSLYLSTIITSVVIGKYIFIKNKFKENIYLQSIVGLLAISLLGLIPVVGGLVKLTAVLFGLGIIFRSDKSK